MRGFVMRAAVFHRSGLPLSIETIDDPQPLPSEMILKVCACGICGTDLHWSEINNAESGKRPTDAVIRKLETTLDIILMVESSPDENRHVNTGQARGLTLGDFLLGGKE